MYFINRSRKLTWCNDACQPAVDQQGITTVIDTDVASFDILVESVVCVEIAQRAGDLRGEPQPRLPTEARRKIIVAELFSKRSPGRKLIQQVTVLALGTVSQETDYVAVPEFLEKSEFPIERVRLMALTG